ncbi:MAG: hypothetical protein V3U65_13685 [Granulosicoccaceae bacterium]
MTEELCSCVGISDESLDGMLMVLAIANDVLISVDTTMQAHSNRLNEVFTRREML